MARGRRSGACQSPRRTLRRPPPQTRADCPTRPAAAPRSAPRARRPRRAPPFAGRKDQCRPRRRQWRRLSVDRCARAGTASSGWRPPPEWPTSPHRLPRRWSVARRKACRSRTGSCPERIPGRAGRACAGRWAVRRPVCAASATWPARQCQSAARPAGRPETPQPGAWTGPRNCPRVPCSGPGRRRPSSADAGPRRSGRGVPSCGSCLRAAMRSPAAAVS